MNTRHNHLDKTEESKTFLEQRNALESSHGQASEEQIPLLLTGALQDILVANQPVLSLMSRKRMSEILIGPPPLSEKD
jgi:hypothetical protein